MSPDPRPVVHPSEGVAALLAGLAVEESAWAELADLLETEYVALRAGRLAEMRRLAQSKAALVARLAAHQTARAASHGSLSPERPLHPLVQAALQRLLTRIRLVEVRHRRNRRLLAHLTRTLAHLHPAQGGLYTAHGQIVSLPSADLSFEREL